MTDLGIASLVASGVAVIVAVVVGKRKGVAEIARQADDELMRLVTAQAGRIAVLESENKRLEARVAALAQAMDEMKEELRMEKMITARFVGDA